MLAEIHQTVSVLEGAGLYWVPVPLGTKQPTERRWQEPRQRPVPTAPTNVGILLTASSGVVDIDLECAQAVKAAEMLARPGTGIVRYGRQRKPVSHVLVRQTEYHGPRRVVDPEARTLLLEVRTDKQQSLVPPSVHPSGETLQWVDAPDGLGQYAPPGTAEALVKRVAAAAVLAMGWEPGTRHDAALALAGWLLREGWQESEVVDLVRATCYAAGDTETSDRVEAVVTTAQRQEDHETTGLPTLVELLGKARVDVVRRLLGQGAKPDRRRNELTIEQVLQALARRTDVRVLPTGAMQWDGTRWVRGPVGVLRPAVVNALQQLGAEAAWMNRVPTLAMMVGQGMVPELMLPEQTLDTAPRVLGLPDGSVVELDTGEVRPARPEEYVTRSTGVMYDPRASRSLFVETLEAATDAASVDYLQLLAGATLIGEPSKLIVIIHGPTDTGKTLFLVDALAAALGEYAVQLDPAKVLRAGADRTELWLSRAVGRRLVVLSEPSREFQVDPAVLKALTGRGTITVRPLYAQPVEVVPTWTIWVDTNWMPEVPDPDDATWRRIRAVRFKHRIRPNPDDPRYDPRFLERWRQEAVPGCLAWAVEGAARVLATSWDPTDAPRAEADDSQEWREAEAESSVHEFVATQLAADPCGFVGRKEVWQAYAEWAAQHPGVPRVGRNTLYEVIRGAGIEVAVVHGARGFKAALKLVGAPLSPIGRTLDGAW